MKHTLAVGALLALSLIGGLAYMYDRHARKQEDAVAAFALSEVDKVEDSCIKRPYNPSEGCFQNTDQLTEYMKTHTSSETLTASMDCLAANAQRQFGRIDACERNHQTAMQEWAVKYPRQAAQKQADILGEKRGRDERDMKKRQ